MSIRRQEYVERGVRHYTLEDAVVASRRTRVLLAEDDLEMRDMLRSQLQRRGFEVVAVQTGPELAHQLSHAAQGDEWSRPFDAVISDVRMPGRTGLDVLKEFRETTWATPFFIITGFGDDWAHQEADRLGARVFDKPFDVREMVDAVRDAAALN